MLIDFNNLLNDHIESVATIHYTDIQVLEDWSENRNEYTIIDSQTDSGLEGQWLAVSYPINVEDHDQYVILDNMIKLQTKENRRTCILIELPTGLLELWVYKLHIEMDRKRRNVL